MKAFLIRNGAVLFSIIALLFLTSCATYNAQVSDYYVHVSNNDYRKANELIDQNKLLKAKRNRLLFLLEKGKMAHMMKQYDESNRFFNEADLFMEDSRASVKDMALGTLLNPMMQTYRGEDFEKFMVHYYKALNYLYLGNTQDALVEARRISLRSYSQQDKMNESNRKFSDDAFSHMLQGIIYERANDFNNAFIAYRNAVNIYLERDGSYYGTSIPLQLKKDLIRSAKLAGFNEEKDYYELKFGLTLMPEETNSGGLVVFWENGLAPVKKEQSFVFTMIKDGVGNFAFVDESGSFNIPFKLDDAHKDKSLKLEDFRSLRVSFPRYEEQPLLYRNGRIELNDKSYGFEPAENINAIAFATLKERFLKEVALALSRLVVKKLAEHAARPKKDDKNKDEKESLAFAIQMFSLASEKADTRNWQSLPHSINYVRLPLKDGANQVTVELTGSSNRSFTLEAQGNGQLSIENLVTLR